MLDPVESPKFVRLEGFFDEQKIQDIREILGETAISSVLFETLPLRDRDEYGPLLSNVRGVGLVVTKNVLSQFSKRLPGGPKMQARADTLFGALRKHLERTHNNLPEGHAGCDCSLEGGRQENYRRYGGYSYTSYLNPMKLIEAFQAGELDELPVGYAREDPKPLKLSVCYGILPEYIDALNS